MTTTRELLTGALRLINVVQANEVPSSQDMEIAQEALNALMDSKSNDLLNIHTITPYQFPLVPGQFKYTLGPGGNWDTTRPMRMEQAKLMLNAIVVTAEPPPVASFTFRPETGFVPLTVAFTNTGTTANSTFLWGFGDGSTSTEENPSHEYVSGGNYEVTLATTTVLGTATSTSQLTLQDYFMTATFYYSMSTVAFQQEILNWLHNHVPYLDPLNYSQGFNQSQLPLGANTLGTGNIFKIVDWSVPNTVIGLRAMSHTAQAYGYVWQFEMYQPIISGRTMFYGYFTEPPGGPAFNPNTPYGGSYSTFLESDGVTSWISASGIITASGLPPIVQGKFVTCIYVPDESTVNFFIDAVWVGAGPAATTGDGYAIIGSNP